MRRLLVSGFAALAVLLGLVITTGVASAAPSSGPPAACTDKDSFTVCPERDRGRGDGLHERADHVPANVYVCPLVNGTRRCNPGGPIRGGGWHPGAPWGGPALYGHQLWVEANLGLDICGYGNSYDTFLNRNLRYRSSIDRLLGRNRWQSLYSSDCNSGLAVLPGGLSLINGSYLNLDQLGLQGAGTVNVCSYPDWTTFDSRFGGRFGNRFGVVRNRFGGNAFNEFRQLRVNAHCTTVMLPSSTTIVQQPTVTETATAEAPAPADDPSAADGASKPLASGPVPSGAVATGGDSPAWVLAHNQAV
jgi:hypothetical protein